MSKENILVNKYQKILIKVSTNSYQTSGFIIKRVTDFEELSFSNRSKKNFPLVKSWFIAGLSALSILKIKQLSGSLGPINLAGKITSHLPYPYRKRKKVREPQNLCRSPALSKNAKIYSCLGYAIFGSFLKSTFAKFYGSSLELFLQG